MRNRLAGWLFLFCICSIVIVGCEENIPSPTQAVPSPLPTIIPTKISSATPLVHEEAIPTTLPTSTPTLIQIIPTDTRVETTPTPTATSTLTTSQGVQTTGMPAPGIWISSHEKKGSRVWIEFEVYYVDGEPMLDVLEACVSYSCDLLGEEFEAEGCSASQSPKEIPIRNNQIQIDFNGIMMETITRQSKLGMVCSHSPESEVITGTWILPACDYWIPFDVRLNAITPTP